MTDREVLADLVVDLTADIHQAITGLLALEEAFVFKVRDNKVIESWMFHQDTVAILALLKQAEQ